MGATAPQPQLPAALYLRAIYPRDIARIGAVVTLRTTVRDQFHPPRPLQWTPPAILRARDDYCYARSNAIELANELAARIEPHDLPLLWTEIGELVPRAFSNRITRQRLLDAKREGFLQLVRWELEAHPRWPVLALLPER